MRSSKETLALTSTSELIHRAHAGDSGAIDRLFTRLYGPIRRWARGRLPRWARDMAETDDLVQEALVQTFRHVGDFEPRGCGSLQAYARQAVLNRIRDELRRAARRPAPAGFNGCEIDPGLSPLDHAIGRQAVDRYERSLARLKPRDREAVIARIELGFDFHELAELIGTPSVEAARKMATRAIVRLAAEMRDDARRSGAD